MHMKSFILSVKKKEYYRIYVKNYVVYYSLTADTMIVEHIFYSKQDIIEIIK